MVVLLNHEPDKNTLRRIVGLMLHHPFIRRHTESSQHRLYQNFRPFALQISFFSLQKSLIKNLSYNMKIVPFVTAVCGLVAGVDASNYYTVFTSISSGLNVTLNGTTNGIEFGPGSPCRYWTRYEVAPEINDWTYYSIRARRGQVYFRYPEYRPRAIAQAASKPSLFRIEVDREGSYVVALESETGEKLAWTAERNTTAPNRNMVVSLQPYKRSRAQRFKIAEEYVNPDDC
ncbi:uncharacterized protein ARB_00805 [Trichophyton benhamiae CBS 112371]|uniref:Uncharacterized protein n=1 Tax=Arthroderma benhamiae (strain ATCC MYA-4681 / CBS 112371) TaxID=663331 RepID=D4AX78_ARTBC|nr:uncharacterized protein ARB_00805 [Trichophyton benhamiae CBS 112371]EFE32283.1 hypothetical protein ARB_00805 [Trichophyton benhamiae CBS 112371]